MRRVGNNAPTEWAQQVSGTIIDIGATIVDEAFAVGSARGNSPIKCILAVIVRAVRIRPGSTPDAFCRRSGLAQECSTDPHRSGLLCGREES
jgi:hypothetical protein